MSRSSELLEAAAGALEQGTDPFHEAWLRSHEVTFDECMDLADSLALGARLLAWAKQNPKKAATLARAGVNGMQLEAVTEGLARLLGKPLTGEEAGQ